MDDITTLDVREAQPTNQLCVGCQVSLRKGTLTYSPQCSTRPSPAPPGAARLGRDRRGARSYTRATTMALSKVDPRIPSNTAPTRSSGLATGTLRTA